MCECVCLNVHIIICVRSQVSTACASVQTESDLDPNLDPVTATRKSTSAKKEQGIQTSLGEHLQPLSVICGTSDYPLPHHPRDSAPLGALAAAALAAEANLDALTTQGRSSRAVGVSYNPFTDPQILQAADGLELLSTLAEKRPKCSSAALVSHCFLRFCFFVFCFVCVCLSEGCGGRWGGVS